MCGDGRAVEISDIVRQGDVQAITFEGAAESASDSLVAPTMDALWAALQDATALRGPSALGFRRRSKGRLPPWMRAVRVRDVDYVAVSKSAFSEAGDLDGWRPALARTVEALFAGEDGLVEIERSGHRLAIWYASALSRAAERGHEFSYDTLQHSSFVYIRKEKSSATSSVDKGATAFLSTETSTEARISWTADGWNPIAGGFILAATR